MKTSVLLHTLLILQQLISNIDLTDNVFEKELGDRAEPDYSKKFQNIKFCFNGKYITLKDSLQERPKSLKFNSHSLKLEHRKNESFREQWVQIHGCGSW